MTRCFFILRSKEVYVHENFAQQLPIPASSEEVMFCVKPQGKWAWNYPTAALLFWKQMVLTHGQHCVICWQQFNTKCYFASPSDFGLTDCWAWSSILHGSLIYVGKQFWCSSTALDEYLTPLDLWLFPALKRFLSSLFCFISSNSSNMMLWIWF